jgi:cystathionine beta-lyase/cystathionine gamma-synthase
MADLEGTETSIALNSGMAAISATLVTLLTGGGHVVASDRLYDLTRDFLVNDLPQFGGSATFVDCSNVAAVDAAVRPETRLIYAEVFSNPTLHVADPRALSAIARNHELPLVIDNTFLSPALLRPVEFGADIVIHSATKYLSGNGQVQGGIISGSRALLEPIRRRTINLGTAMSPFAAWLLLAGVHTLHLRMERHSNNATRLARLLSAHPAVGTVHYPGLPSDPGHAVASALIKAQSPGCGGMLAFTLENGHDAVGRFLDALQICTIAVSLGDSSTLVWPWPCGDLIRVSTGLEDSEDLERDFVRSLDALVPATAVTRLEGPAAGGRDNDRTAAGDSDDC